MNKLFVNHHFTALTIANEASIVPNGSFIGANGAAKQPNNTVIGHKQPVPQPNGNMHGANYPALQPMQVAIGYNSALRGANNFGSI